MCSHFRPVYLDEKAEDLVASIHRDLSFNYGVCYLAYFCEINFLNIRVSYTSNPDWQDSYVKNNMIQSCHLYRAATNLLEKYGTNRIILPWETVSPRSRIELDIDASRYEKGIPRNGISFCQKNSFFREFIAVAPDYNDKNFLSRVSKSFNYFKTNLLSLRSIGNNVVNNNNFKSNN